VINKLRALGSWYTKGLEGGSQLRVRINSTESVADLRGLIADFHLGCRFSETTPEVGVFWGS
jgi:hypothetical protein